MRKLALYPLEASTLDLKIESPSQTPNLKAVRGRILNPIDDRRCDFYDDAILVARLDQGKWLIDSLGDAAEIARKYGWELESIHLNEGTLLPPFYDTHFHWVQDDVRNMPKTSLLEWLERFTFPEEARFADADYAERKAKAFWGKILSTGTAGGLCYSSIHSVALDAAMKHAPASFRIGGSLMTMNCPEFLTQSQEQAIAAATYGCETYGDRYCITPRFAPATHPEVMSVAAELAKAKGLFAQTHLGETKAEIEWVLDIYRNLPGFEDVATYTEIYHRCGLLGPKTVLGHAIYLEPSEWKQLADSGTAIASCPTSNAPLPERGLGSGLFNFTQAEEWGVPWSLASDIGGGPFLSMFDVMRSFVSQNRAACNPEATYTKALYRSTLAGAAILGYGKDKGNFTAGKSFDFVQCISPPITAGASSAEALLAATIEQANDRSEYDAFVLSTVIDGKTVFEKETTPR